MKVLLLGNGAREHALAWAFERSKRNAGLFCLPGNAGTEDIAHNMEGDPNDPAAVVAAYKACKADIVIIGPEGPLAAGVADALRAEGAKVFGPGANAARLESSKSFARSFSERAGIPSALSARFSSYRDFDAWLTATRGSLAPSAPFKGKIVLKKSGLAAGKGVLESDDVVELRAFAQAVLASDELLVEEFLVGYELSVFALTDGERYCLLPACADHKKAFDGNKGPNTGGMGAVCPVPPADSALMERIDREIVAPSFTQMEKEGLGYRGALFFGIMVCEDGPKLLEYNVRLGDPETQSLVPLLAMDIGDLFEAVASGSVAGLKPQFRGVSAVGLTVAAPGYPEAYPKGLAVKALPQADGSTLVFHAGTVRGKDGGLLTGGGRCFTVVGLGADYFEAHAKALEGAKAVDFKGAWHRSDIGKSFFIE